MYGHTASSSEGNLTALSAISTFVCARRYENMSMHQVMQGIKLENISWLQGKQNSKSRPSITNLQRRREILQAFLLWLFDAFIVDLIRVCIRLRPLVQITADYKGRPTFM